MSKTIEQKIAYLEEKVRMLESVVLEGKPYFPGQAEWDRAIEALAQGDVGPLVEYRKRGGITPVVPASPRRGGRRPKTGQNGGL
jgi:hypothetical protein